jgi:hypothetical protein
MPTSCGLIPDGRDALIARIQRLLANTLPRILFQASSLSVLRDRAGRGNGDQLELTQPCSRNTDRKAHLDPKTQVGPFKVRVVQAPDRTVPQAGTRGRSNVWGFEKPRSRDRRRMFPIEQVAILQGIPGRRPARSWRSVPRMFHFEQRQVTKSAYGWQ